MIDDDPATQGIRRDQRAETFEELGEYRGMVRRRVMLRTMRFYDAINRGISRASGDAIGLMHSDDFFAHDRVLERVAEALSDPAVEGVYGDLDYVSASDPARVIRDWRSGAYAPAKLRRGWMPPHPTLYLRREVFDTWGLYDTSFRIAADYDAMLRYLAKGEIRLAYIPEVLVKMRVGGESNRSLGRILRKSRETWTRSAATAWAASGRSP